MKNLKRFFMSIFILIFSSVCLVNLDTSASALNYASGKYSGFSCVCGTGDGYFFDFKQKKKIPITLETLCNEINEPTGGAIPSEINDQQLMVCKSLYFLFRPSACYDYNLDVVLNILFQNEQIIYLCSGDLNLDCKIKSILTEEFSKTLFYNYYVIFMSSLKRNYKADDEITRADALLLLSYVYLYTEDMISEEDPIFNIDEMLDLKILLKQIFSGTIYKPILDVFLYY